MRGIDAAATAESDWLDVLVQTLPAFCLSITFLIAIFLFRARVRVLHDLCGRGLGGRRDLNPTEVNSHHADRSGAFQQASESSRTRAKPRSRERQNHAPNPSHKEFVRRQPSGEQWERSLPFRPRGPSSEQDRHFPPYRRALPEKSIFQGTEAQSQNTSFPDLSSRLHELHRSEADNFYGSLSSSGICGLRTQASGQSRAEIPRRFLGVNTEPSEDGVWRTLDTSRATGDMEEGWDNSEGCQTSDEDPEHEDFDGALASMIGNMRSLGVAAGECLEGANVRHTLRRRARRAHLRGGGGDDFEPSGSAQNSNIRSCSDDEGDEDDDQEEGSCIEDPPFQYDAYEDAATVGLSRYPADQPPPPRALAPNDERRRRPRPRATHPDGPLLTVRQNEIIEDADPSISLSQPDQVLAVGASRGSSVLQPAPPTVIFSAEVAEECDDILGDLDATYGHIALAQRKLNELLQRAGATERPLLRQIILSHNELYTREMELATLKTYVARMRATVEAPNEGLFDEILDFIEVEDGRRTGSRDAAGSETVVGQYIPPTPSRRPWGWKPKLRGHHHYHRQRKPSKKEKDGKDNRQHRPSDLSRPGETSGDDGITQPSPARPCYRQPLGLDRHDNLIQELDGTQIFPRPTSPRRQPRRRRGPHSHQSSNERGSETQRSRDQRSATPGPNTLSCIRARRIPIAADMVGVDLYDVITRMADEGSGTPSVSQRHGDRGRSSGGGGGPWPWPGPGGPIPDPVAPPYA